MNDRRWRLFQRVEFTVSTSASGKSCHLPSFGCSRVVAGEPNFHFALDIFPFLGRTKSREQVVELRRVLLRKLEPRQEIKRLRRGQVAAVMQQPRDGGQVVQADLRMVRLFLKNSPSPVMRAAAQRRWTSLGQWLR